MEGIVVGIAQINFHQNLSGISEENNAPNFGMNPCAIMSSCGSPTSNEPANFRDQDTGNSALNRLSGVESISDSGWEEIEGDLEKSTPQDKKGYTFEERRHMPARASKESSLLGRKRRSIIKPTKRTKNQVDLQNLKPSDIKKIYLNKKLTKFKPSSLETIYEEASNCSNNDQDCSRLMSGRKIRRLVSFSDGLGYSKTLLNKRRAKIKKTFGKRFALKKISLEEFITKLNTSIEESEDALSHGCKMEEGRREITKGVSYSEHFISNTTEVVREATNPPPT